MTFSKAFFCIWSRAELSISTITNIIEVEMENYQNKQHTVMNLVLMEACPVGCFFKEIFSFVDFYGKIILLLMKKCF